MELANQLSQGFVCGGGARPWEGPSCAAVGSHPLNCTIFLHKYAKGRRGISLSLCWFVCKTGIHQFVSQDQMSSWGWNVLTLNLLWSLRAYQCEMGSDLQDSGLYYKCSYCERPHRWVCKQPWHPTHSYSCCQETTEAQRCVMGFLGTVIGEAVFDQYLLSYN